MPDHSAEGRLPLPEKIKSFTEEDVDLLDRALAAADCRHGAKAGTIITHFPRENALRAPGVWHGWTAVRRTKIAYAGPWVEVDPAETITEEEHVDG